MLLLFKSQEKEGFSMKNIKKLVMSSLVGVMALSSVGVGSVGAEDSPNKTTASVTFNKNPEALSFTSATSTIDFGTIDFTFAEVHIPGASLPDANPDPDDFLIKLTDDRAGSELKWDLTASVASETVNGLPTGSKITFNSGVVTSEHGFEFEGVNPDISEDLVLKVGDESEAVSNAIRTAKTKQGIGAWTLRYPAAEMTLDLTPAHMAAMSDMSAEAGTYSTTITWTLTAGK